MPRRDHYTPPFIRVAWALVWLALAIWVVLVAIPLSSRLTRSAELACLAVFWFGLIALKWQDKLSRTILLGITVLTVVCIFVPAKPRSPETVAALRSAYLDGLRRYSGCSYSWGGEGFTGIDCSGLIRRGLIEALITQGVTTYDPASLREAVGLWWNDTTAQVLGEGQGMTVAVPGLQNAKSINDLPPAQLLPGDMAVTTSGVHILAYLGDATWIEADPAFGVITVPTPSKENGWFHVPVNVVRWRLLGE